MHTIISRCFSIFVLVALTLPTVGCLSPLGASVAGVAGLAAPFVFSNDDEGSPSEEPLWDGPNDDCFAVQEMTSGSVLQGDTSDVNQGTTSVLDG